MPRTSSSVASAASVLAAVVLVHESGHFVAATSRGIHISQFSVGFSPALARFRVGPVEYTLRSIPLGGYVGFPDDDPESGFALDDPDLLFHRPVLDRPLVVSAGVVANLVFALRASSSFTPRRSPLASPYKHSSPASSSRSSPWLRHREPGSFPAMSSSPSPASRWTCRFLSSSTSSRPTPARTAINLDAMTHAMQRKQMNARRGVRLWSKDDICSEFADDPTD
ncbi:hypothetical protein ABZP36_005379 [Zizania latifolia]